MSQQKANGSGQHLDKLLPRGTSHQAASQDVGPIPAPLSLCDPQPGSLCSTILLDTEEQLMISLVAFCVPTIPHCLYVPSIPVIQAPCPLAISHRISTVPEYLDSILGFRLSFLSMSKLTSPVCPFPRHFFLRVANRKHQRIFLSNANGFFLMITSTCGVCAF